MSRKVRIVLLAAAAASLVARAAGPADAHCDALDGPVVVESRQALESGDVTPVLKWVSSEHEKEVMSAFQKTRSVRSLSADARSIADTFFFETVVRLHRAGEGAPYTGLKEHSDEGEAVRAADASLSSGDVDALVQLLTKDVDKGVRQHHARMMAARSHADESVEHGRAFVESYVRFIHFAKALEQVAGGGDDAHGQHSPPAAGGSTGAVTHH